MSCNAWKEYTIEELCSVIDSLHKSPKYVEYGYPIIRVKDMNEGFLKFENPAFVTKEVYEEFSKKHKPKKGDMLFSRVGSYGITTFVDKDVEFCLGQNTVVMTDYKYKIINNRFMYYMMISDIVKEQIEMLVTGSTQKTISMKSIKSIKIPTPSIEEQEKIANILSSLDDKIQLNNEMNKTLEDMAQNIFKRWFVDFEFPSGDGEHYKSNGGEMVDSELGMIPKEWEVKSIGDIGNVITGKTPSSKVEGSYGDECNFITPRDITSSPIIIDTERKLSSIGINNLKKNLVCKNSIGVSCIGSNLGEVYITGENSITNQQINTLVLKEGKIYPYVYIYLKNMKEGFLNMASGSAVPIINKTSFSGINILMPDMYILNKFVQSTTCYFERIEENLKENESLIALRDSLFPKLMSGEIDINL